ncbi:MAG TPA: DUF4911 domain-containing protein [Syntrophobacteraceae bacterium]|nr:DUF4911 domain-containing protein [Syntrophobacteraceae bacterium]
MKGFPRTCSKHHLILSPREIHMLRFILEAYEGLGLITTLDPHLGLIELNVAPGCEEEVAQILVSEEENLQLRLLWPNHQTDAMDMTHYYREVKGHID